MVRPDTVRPLATGARCPGIERLIMPDMIEQDAATRFGHLRREPVVVTFSDGGAKAGWLAGAHDDVIEVEHIDMTGGGHIWTAQYTLTGDADTPHVVDVAVIPAQAETLFDQGDLFA
jgi:hypothetical protein